PPDAAAQRGPGGGLPTARRRLAERPAHPRGQGAHREAAGSLVGPLRRDLLQLRINPLTVQRVPHRAEDLPRALEVSARLVALTEPLAEQPVFEVHLRD